MNCLFKDLSDNPGHYPEELTRIIDKNSDMDLTYDDCRNLINELESIGHTCDYGLDAIPYNLQKI